MNYISISIFTYSIAPLSFDLATTRTPPPSLHRVQTSILPRLSCVCVCAYMCDLILLWLWIIVKYVRCVHQCDNVRLLDLHNWQSMCSGVFTGVRELCEQANWWCEMCKREWENKKRKYQKLSYHNNGITRIR